ncbi:hypothetical protein [Ruegeria arenilitoris]|uniref:hypothetical protein n=1 Tax=Ruegeria arenilitoris TaxID=1173585 RepID=UPI001C94E591|nr:hypothetical protein [Ruegeria arenilitoris]MBY6082052.1 hypothetical protein [Ruegeria arenilitoris]
MGIEAHIEYDRVSPVAQGLLEFWLFHFLAEALSTLQFAESDGSLGLTQTKNLQTSLYETCRHASRLTWSGLALNQGSTRDGQRELHLVLKLDLGDIL